MFMQVINVWNTCYRKELNAHFQSHSQPDFSVRLAVLGINDVNQCTKIVTLRTYLYFRPVRLKPATFYHQ
jgi:hypothetical protein